jgi:hypothetical protein
MKKFIVIICYMALSFSLHAQGKPDVINSQGGSSTYSGGYLAYSVGETVIGTSAGTNTILSAGFLQTWQSFAATRIIIKLFLEGLYNNNSQMREAQSISGPQFGSGIADKIDVEFHAESYPYSKEYEFSNLNLRTNGTLDIYNLPSDFSGSYYLVLKHRNSIETWSAQPYNFEGTGPFFYDFSTSASQAYGNNLKQIGSIYAIWGSDASQDGVVDGTDLALVDNASKPPPLVGYNIEDVNGDGVVDGSDMAMVDNSSRPPVVQVIKPQ